MEFISLEGLEWFANAVIIESCRVLDLLSLGLPYEPTTLQESHLSEILAMEEQERAAFRENHCTISNV